MSELPNTPGVPPPSAARSTTRFGARAVLAAVALNGPGEDAEKEAVVAGLRLEPPIPP
jgi:hypothetical protein